MSLKSEETWDDDVRVAGLRVGFVAEDNARGRRARREDEANDDDEEEEATKTLLSDEADDEAAAPEPSLWARVVTTIVASIE